MVSVRLTIFICIAEIYGERLSTQGHELEQISQAATWGQWNVVKYLAARNDDLDAEDKYGMTPIAFAAIKGQLEVVKDLAARNVNLDAKA